MELVSYEYDGYRQYHGEQARPDILWCGSRVPLVVFW